MREWVNVTHFRYDAAEDWIAAGARIVGGCCGIGPEHIRALHQRLAQRGP